jgi:hypothetical protein
MTTMDLRKQLTAVANDLRNTMIKSFGHIADPEYGYKAKYANFPIYTEKNVFERLSENLQESYIEAVFHFDEKYVEVFVEENGFHFLLGDHFQYNDFSPVEQKKWYKSAKTVASFLSIITATGTQLGAFEDIAKLTKQTMTHGAQSKSPIDNMTDMFRNPAIRNLMKGAIPNANVMADLIQKSGPLMDCMGSGSVNTIVLPTEIILTDDIILLYKVEKMQRLEEETKKETASSEPSTDRSVELPSKIQEECMEEEAAKASELMKGIFNSPGGVPKNPTETMKGLAKLLGKFTKNKSDMDELFSSVTTAFDKGNTSSLDDISSISSKYRKQIFHTEKSKDMEKFLFAIPSKPKSEGMIIEEVVEEAEQKSSSSEDNKQSEPEKDTNVDIPPMQNMDYSEMFRKFQNMGMGLHGSILDGFGIPHSSTEKSDTTLEQAD